jgi:RNA-directed DNA polymerase
VFISEARRQTPGLLHPAEQHGYRPGLSAHTAVKEIDRLIDGGHTRIIDGDLADYFGSIPHDELLTSVARRV